MPHFGVPAGGLPPLGTLKGQGEWRRSPRRAMPSRCRRASPAVQPPASASTARPTAAWRPLLPGTARPESREAWGGPGWLRIPPPLETMWSGASRACLTSSARAPTHSLLPECAPGRLALFSSAPVPPRHPGPGVGEAARRTRNMSMLAERRRKQKWAVDPRNTAWSNDDSKFGQRMLEKMGWSKGKGLGAQEQGATEHIKVQVKNNHLGLGATNNNEDNWIAHQDDFNQLLAALNSCHGQEIADSSDNKEKKSFSLEEKSKIAKNRVHYMKFTKGKDLSSRSKTDLDCIFGKRGSKKTTQDDCSPCAVDETEASMTTTSAFTIQEYFAKRMAQLKNKPRAPAPGPDLSETPMEWKKGKEKTKEAAGVDAENCPQPKAKRPKKKKREEESQGPVAKERARAEQLPRGPSEDKCSDASAEVRGDYAPNSQDGALKPKKKKAKKKLHRPGEVAVDTRLDKVPVRKRKKKKASS